MEICKLLKNIYFAGEFTKDFTTLIRLIMASGLTPILEILYIKYIPNS